MGCVPYPGHPYPVCIGYGDWSTAGIGLAAIESGVNRSVLLGIRVTDKNCYRSDRLAHHKRAALTKVFLSKLVFTIRYTATLVMLVHLLFQVNTN